jgi:hypothetical protein
VPIVYVQAKDIFDVLRSFCDFTDVGNFAWKQHTPTTKNVLVIEKSDMFQLVHCMPSGFSGQT